MSTEEDDDIFGSIGLNISPTTPEDRLWSVLAAGNFSKIDNLRYWLKSELSRLEDMLDNNIKITKAVMRNGVLQDAPLTRLDYSRIAINYYLLMYHYPWFEARANFEPVDRAAMIDRIMEHPGVKKLIENDVN